MSDDLVIRPATDADVPWIVALERRADMLARIGGGDPAQHRAWLADPDARQVIAELGGVRAGFAVLQGLVATPDRPKLRRIAVAAPGGGVGSRLLRWVIEASFAEGATALRLTVFADNAPARAVYGRFGFVDDPDGGVEHATRRDGSAGANLPLILHRPDAAP